MTALWANSESTQAQSPSVAFGVAFGITALCCCYCVAGALVLGAWRRRRAEYKETVVLVGVIPVPQLRRAPTGTTSTTVVAEVTGTPGEDTVVDVTAAAAAEQGRSCGTIESLSCSLSAAALVLPPHSHPSRGEHDNIKPVRSCFSDGPALIIPPVGDNNEAARLPRPLGRGMGGVVAPTELSHDALEDRGERLFTLVIRGGSGLGAHGLANPEGAVADTLPDVWPRLSATPSTPVPLWGTPEGDPRTPQRLAVAVSGVSSDAVSGACNDAASTRQSRAPSNSRRIRGGPQQFMPGIERLTDLPDCAVPPGINSASLPPPSGPHAASHTLQQPAVVEEFAQAAGVAAAEVPVDRSAAEEGESCMKATPSQQSLGAPHSPAGSQHKLQVENVDARIVASPPRIPRPDVASPRFASRRLSCPPMLPQVLSAPPPASGGRAGDDLLPVLIRHARLSMSGLRDASAALEESLRAPEVSDSVVSPPANRGCDVMRVESRVLPRLSAVSMDPADAQGSSDCRHVTTTAEASGAARISRLGVLVSQEVIEPLGTPGVSCRPGGSSLRQAWATLPAPDPATATPETRALVSISLGVDRAVSAAALVATPGAITFGGGGGDAMPGHVSSLLHEIGPELRSQGGQRRGGSHRLHVRSQATPGRGVAARRASHGILPSEEGEEAGNNMMGFATTSLPAQLERARVPQA